MHESRALPTLLLLSSLLLAGCRSSPGPGLLGPPASISRAIPFAEGGEKTRLTARLANGASLLLEEDHVAPVVALQLWYRAGRADEPRAQAGSLDVLLPWMVQGTPGRGLSAARTVSGWGGTLRAWTSPDATVFSFLVPSSKVSEVIALAAELVRSAPGETDAAGFEVARRQAIEALAAREGEPLAQATSALLGQAFGVHPYGRALGAPVAALPALGASTVRGAHAQLLGPERLSVLLVGDFDRKALRGEITAAFERLPARAGLGSEVTRVPEPASTGGRALVVPRPPHEGDGVLTLGFRLPAASDDDVLAAEVLAAVLAHDGGGVGGGRLLTTLVRNRHLVTSVDTFLLAGRDPGLLVYRARLGTGTVEEATQAALDEIARLGREDLGAEELARARLVVSQENARRRGTLEGYVGRLGWAATVLGRPEGEEKLRDRLAKLGPAALRRAAARLFVPDQAAVVALVPDGEARGQAERAAALGARLASVVRETPARLDRLFAEHPVKPESLRRARGGATVVRRELASGVHAVVVSDRALPEVYARATWSGGLRAEDARDFGAAQLLCRVLASGPRALSAEETLARVSAAGGRLEGFADEDTMGVAADFLPESADPGLALLVESLRHPRFSDEDVERAKRLLIDRRRTDEKYPGELARRAFFETLWPRQPYRLDPRGSTISLAALDRRRLLDHYRRHYPLSSLTFLVAGDVDAEQVLSQLDRWFGDRREAAPWSPLAVNGGPGVGRTQATALTSTLSSTPVAPSAPTPASEVSSAAGSSQEPAGPAPATAPTEPAPVEIFRTTDRNETHLLLGARAPARREPDVAAVTVLWELLAGSRGRLRVALGPVTPLGPVRALWFQGIEGGAMAIDLVAPPDKLPDVVATLRAEVARLISQGAEAQEVARARDWLVGRRSLALGDRAAVFSAMARDEALGLGLDLYRGEIDRLAQVQVADVNRAARTWLTPARQVVTVVQPADSKSRAP